jgi:hypothetical protein
MAAAVCSTFSAAALLAISSTGPGVASARTHNEQPKRCAAGEVRVLVHTFITAFNNGDVQTLDRLFAKEPVFRWFGTTAPGARLRATATNRATLVSYFASRHRRSERLLLRSLQVNGNTIAPAPLGPYGNFEYGLMRQASDLAATRYYGKGAARCFPSNQDVIFVWSMAHE